jgi:hypothetical protein
MARRRDIIILIALFVALAVFTILGPGRSQEETFENRLTTYSSAPGGALALLRWTQAMGYDARRLEFTDFAIDPQTRALFILNPSVRINRTESGEVLEWVEAGGTLILVDDRVGFLQMQNELLQSLDIATEPYDDEDDAPTLEQAAVLQPVFDAPPLEEVTLNTRRVLEASRDDVAHLVGANESTALMGIKRGTGYIYISSASFPFTNEGLRSEQSAALVLNLLQRVPADGRILFDEYHHGFFTPPSLRTVLLDNAWGWALIYALATLALYMLLTGRRFGKPIPLREETARRSSIEYVESMADLFQRGEKSGFVLQHYHTAFKRRLARPFGVNPRLDDAAFVKELARHREIDEPALLALLNRMRRERIDEAELLRVVAESDNTEIHKK